MIETKPVRQVPGWLSGLMVVACAIGLGWFVWTSWLGASPRERIVIMEKGPRDKVTSYYSYSEIRWGDAKVVVRKSESQEGDYDFSFIDEQKKEIPPDQRRILEAMVRLERQPLLRASIGLSSSQFDEVKVIRKGGAQELPDDERAKLKELWVAYEAVKGDPAKQKAAEKKLLKAVDVLTNRLRPLILQSAADRAAKAKTILTPEQWQKLDQASKRE